MTKPTNQIVFDALTEPMSVLDLFRKVRGDGITESKMNATLKQLEIRKVPYVERLEDGRWQRAIDSKIATFITRPKKSKHKPKPPPVAQEPGYQTPAKKPLSPAADRFLEACTDFVGVFEHQREALENITETLRELGLTVEQPKMTHEDWVEQGMAIGAIETATVGEDTYSMIKKQDPDGPEVPPVHGTITMITN